MTHGPHAALFARLGQFVVRHWVVVILAWVALLAVTTALAPDWDDVTYDGDLAYLPATMTSVRAEALLERAFPRGRAKSQMAILAARDSAPLTPDDLAAIDRIAARFHNLLGISRFQQSQALWQRAAELRASGNDRSADEVFQQADEEQHRAIEAWDEAVRLDPRLSTALNNRAFYLARLGRHAAAQREAQLAKDYAPSLSRAGSQLVPAMRQPLPILDIWTRYTDVVGSKLRSADRRAELVVLRLSQEFMATDNMRILELVYGELAAARSSARFPRGLSLAVTGSAAVGGDMLQSAAESIQNTELYTVALVVLILILVYRAPLLVAIPLITIVVSVSVATGWVAALTRLDSLPGFDWWNFKIFTTTKIFVVVILFGSGTDFCLFLIARYKEELERHTDRAAAVAGALGGVGEALTGSALTTILGLATMFFAQFGKFRNSGPAIGLCLAVTLAACLTLAPALLRAFGPMVFWPYANGRAPREPGRRALFRHWEWLARLIVNYPGRVLAFSVLALAPLALAGTRVDVTYDFLSELGDSRPSKSGSQRMKQYFPVGETGPIELLAHVPGGNLDAPAGKVALAQLTKDLYVDGIASVRSLSEPRGERPNGFSLKKAALQSHQLTRSLYLSQRPELGGDVARFELLLKHDPFSLAALEVLNHLGERLEVLTANSDSYWYRTDFVFGGTTAAIRDLRQVTQGDNLRIQVLVVLAVFAVLLAILRRPAVCCYLIVSVLFSYYVTLGATELFFQFAYGETFHGLDWKVPLFLFVILVAIGEDYNIYLATRVFEEQATHGLFGGLRRAIVHTGGIITSCGVIMAGTFVSMTSGSLRGIVELGFALSLGVLIDTFVVRPVLVPAFLALLFRSFARASLLRTVIRPPHRLSNWRRGSRDFTLTGNSGLRQRPENR